MILDPITLEVLTEGLISVVREMRATVFRTARSVAIYEAKDFSCGLFDPASNVVAQSEDIGSHVVPLPWSVRSAMEQHGATLAPGDVILTNDPYRGGTHLNDVTVIYPVFADGRLIFFPAVREHWADVGGMVPGSMSGKATEIYQEGVRIPPIKIVEGGRINQAAIDLLLANMRVPDERLGDFHASLSACRTAERRIHELCRRYGVETLLAAIAQNMDRSEARMRAKIAALPDGEYYFEDYLETFQDGRLEPLLLPMKLTIAGDGMVADMTGASPQVPVPVNSTLAVSAGGVLIAVKSIFDPDAPLNQGSLRPIEVVAPPGTIVNVQAPAPAGSHGEIRKRVLAVMVGALAQVAPRLVAGDLCRTSFHNMIGGIHPRTGKEWVHYEWSAGGSGAFLEGDGPSAMATIDWGDLTTVQPTEVLETRMPLMIDFSLQATDSGGPGTTRGGLSMRRRLRLTSPRAAYSLLSDGAVLPAFGVLGGFAGAPVSSHVERDGVAEAFDMPGKVAGHPLRAGDAVVIRSAGGGGYGDPLERPLARVLDDLEQGYVSPESAHGDYGLVLAADGGIDVPASEAARAAIRAARVTLAVVEGADCYEAGSVSRRRICRINPASARDAGLRADDIVELMSPTAAPLRAWVVLDPAVGAGTLPLDALGRRVIQAALGARVHVRLLARGLLSASALRREAAE
ncbi:MAG: hydantoinase B/oxoprolinase family protein [Alphaproteobacteria bacterium]|nr:hydantoinase B/oxoprolinase family protein [Alphaproteobacteria bacterium]